jgi:hypothetical protein
MFLRKICWREKQYYLLNNPNIYNIEGNNRLSLGLQPLTTGSVLKMHICSVRFHNCILHTGNYFVVFCKTKHSSLENAITEPDLTDVHTIQSFPSSDANIESCQPEGGCFPEDFNPRERSLSMVDNLTLT